MHEAGKTARKLGLHYFPIYCKVHPCTGTEALHRPLRPIREVEV